MHEGVSVSARIDRTNASANVAFHSTRKRLPMRQIPDFVASNVAAVCESGKFTVSFQQLCGPVS